MNDQISQSGNLNAKVDNCCDAILKVQQNIEEQLPNGHAKRMQNYWHVQMDNDNDKKR